MQATPRPATWPTTSLLAKLFCLLARPFVRGQYSVERRSFNHLVRAHRFLDHVPDADKLELVFHESRHGDFVGGIHYRGQRAAARASLAREAQRGEAIDVR